MLKGEVMTEKPMSILRVSKNKDNPYVMIDKRAINDDRLSWKAKGILSYCLSMPDDWTFYVSELVKHAIDGISSLRAGLKELEDAGYITKEQTRDITGKIAGFEWIVYESPTISRLSTYGKPTYGKSHATNKDSTNKNKKNKDMCVGEPQLEFALLDYFCEITGLDMPVAPHEEIFWVREAGKWLKDGATKPDILASVKEADKRGTTLARPSGITSYMKSAIARRKRGVQTRQQSIEKTNQELLEEMYERGEL